LYHACARTSDDDVYCWGDNEFGQIGDGTLDDARDPVVVSGLDLLGTSESSGGHSRGGGGGGSASRRSVTLDPSGGMCVDEGSHTSAWTTRFLGSRTIPGPDDCARSGFRLSGWANASSPGSMLALESETGPTGRVRYIVRSDASLVAVWTPLAPSIIDLGVFANFGCTSCTNAWIYFTRPAYTNDFEVSVDGTPTSCAIKGYFFDLALCELRPLTPGRFIRVDVTPLSGSIRASSVTTTFTLLG
jgi:hypothetical protein